MKEFTMSMQSLHDRPRRREADRVWDRFNDRCARWFMDRRLTGQGPEVLR
jgi:hypothetical protein